MDLDLSPEQKLVLETARDFANTTIAPRAAEIDRSHAFPRDLIAELGKMGFMGIAIPQAHGGAGMDTVTYALALEEISRACASTGVIVSVNNSLVCDPLLIFGSDEQKMTWLHPLASGTKLGCFALSEPDSGSDAAAQKTTARRDGEHWVLSGTKNFITNAPVADVAIVMAMTDLSKGHHGISAFVVPLSTEGVRVGPPDQKLGIRGALSAQVFFDDCRLPASALLGNEGEGWKVAMKTLDGGRIGIAAQAVGIGRAAFEAAMRYALERKSFGKIIAEHQAIQFKLADMSTDLDAARLLLWRAAAAKDAGVARYTKEAAMAKLFASEACNRIAREAVQIFGGYGYLEDYPVERHFRDAKITEIYEGTSEIQRLVIADAVVGG
ncbi:MAG: acyl-CoA dehydrogenase [Deltaproteobacteria bacterium]|nr:acyl-CoA dehydrogenase [Deltaproteobacteria bacterium]